MDTLLEIVMLLVVLGAVYGLMLWARKAETDRSAYVGLYLLYGIPGGLLTVAGLALAVNRQENGWFVLALGLSLTVPLIIRKTERTSARGFAIAGAIFGLAALSWLVQALTAAITDNRSSGSLADIFYQSAWILLTIGALVLALLVLNWLVGSAWIPMDRASTIDMMGLGVILSLTTYFGWAITLDTDPDELTSAVTVSSQVINVAFFILVAYVAVGTNIYRNGREATERLGIRWPTLPDIVVGVAAVIPAFMLSILGSVLTLYFQPDLFEDLGETMEEMSAGTDVTLVAVLIFASAGLGEEILFRGAIQPRFGIVLTSAFWALVHTQYQFSFVVLGLFLVGLLFGVMRKYVSTTSAIIAHALYNAAVVLLQSVG